MFDTIAPRYDLMNRLLTFGLDIGWRRTAVRALALPGGSTVLDVATGTGDLCRELAAHKQRPVGVDLSLGMLMHARTDAPLAQADGLALPFPESSADGATCGFALRNVVDLPMLFRELARVVRPRGRIALLEVDAPTNPLLRAGHRVYFGTVVPRIGGLLSDRAAYSYLPKSVAYLPAWPDLASMIRAAGFVDVARRRLTLGIAQLISATREGASPR